MEEESKTGLSQEEFENKMFLQLEVMKYAIEKTGVSEAEWAEKNSDNFRQLFENSDIAERFKNVQDKNPEALYAWIQGSLDKMGE